MPTTGSRRLLLRRLRGSADHEVLFLERANRAGIGPEQRRRLLHDLFEDGGRVQLGRKHAACTRELLRQCARGALGFEQLTPFERPPRRVAEVTGKLEILVGELVLFGKEDQH